MSSHLVVDGTNVQNVTCKYCKSTILKPKNAAFIQHEFDLPTITQNVKNTSPTTENITEFWKVDDMYTFHNVGFSNTVDNYKYLACADCYAGPIGYFDIEHKVSYVALCRVAYEP